MILGISEIQKLIKSNNLISNLSKREIENPEGTVIDLRLDKLFKLEGKGFLGIEERETPEAKEVCGYEEGKTNSHVIKPGEYYLTRSMEEVNLPENIGSFFFTRTTLFRSGIAFFSGNVDPGYHGFITSAIYNAGGCDFEIEMGARFCSICFYDIKGSIKSLYRGQWQGGRESATKREKQV